MSEKDKREIAYHEAGHAVIGYLFYPPVELCTIIPTQTEFGRYLGRTICNIPFITICDEFNNELFFPLSLKLVLYSWSGEYFQRKISKNIDVKEFKIDKEFLSLYFDDNILNVLELFKADILEIFFCNEFVNLMVDEVADELQKKESLYQVDIEAMLSKYNFDFDKQIELIMNELYLPICLKYKEL
jgi:hypothetical protein